MPDRRQRPPVVAILFLIGFLLAGLYFVAARQLTNSKAHRLRLLAGFSGRVETTVADLAQRFKRIAREQEDCLGDDEQTLEDYVDQLPYMSFVDDVTEPWDGDEATESAEDSEVEPGPPPRSLQALPLGGEVYLVYSGPAPHCPPAEAKIVDSEASDGERAVSSVAGSGSTDPVAAPKAAARRRVVRVRLDLAELLSPILLPGSFDSLLIAQANGGDVLYQQGEPELRFTSLQPIVQGMGEGAGSGGGEPSAVERLLGGPENRSRGLLPTPSTGSVELEVAEEDYRFFFQPLTIELPVLEGEAPAPAVRWVAGGFVSSDRLLAASFTSSPVLLFALLAVFPLGVLAWPFLKLGLVPARQRLSRLDVAFLVLSALLSSWLLTVVVLDVSFWLQTRETTFGQLETMSDRLAEQFYDELDTARRQLAVLDGRRDPEGAGVEGRDWKHDICRAGKVAAGGLGQPEPEPVDCKSPDVGGCLAERLGPAEAAAASTQGREPSAGEETGAVGSGAGRSGQGARYLDHYPIFHSVFWVDGAGVQRLKLALRSESARAPPVAQRAYFRCAMGRAPYYLVPRDPKQPRQNTYPLCLESVISNSGGADQAILALPAPRRLEPPEPRQPGETPEPLVCSDLDALPPVMSTRLAAFTRALLPAPFGFAVVDAGDDGRAPVLFHADARRVLSEDLLKASDENALLGSLLETRRAGRVELRYWGEQQWAYVRPLPGLPWALVTFRATGDLRLRNAELAYDMVNPFLLFVLPAYVICFGLLAFVRGFHRLIWPDPDKLGVYRGAVVGCLLLVGLFNLLLALETKTFPGAASPLLFVVSLGLVPAVLVAFGWAGHGVDRRRDPGYRGQSLGRGAVRKAVKERLRGLGERAGNLVSGGLGVAGSDRRRFTVRGLGVVGAGLAMGGFLLAPSLPTSLLLGDAALIAWAWYLYRHNFEGRQRQRAYVVAASCLLAVVTILPAIGLFQLAQERQWTFRVQEEAESLEHALEAHRSATLASHVAEREFFAPYRDQLMESWRDLGGAFFHFSSRPAPRRPHPAPSDGGPGSAGWPWRGTLANRFSARPIPMNELSSESTGVDLSRFASTERTWVWGAGASLEASELRWIEGRVARDHGTGAARVLRAAVPLDYRLPEGWTAVALGFAILLALWLPFPWLLIQFISHRVFFISLADVQPAQRVSEEDVATAAAAGLEGILAPLPDLTEVAQLLAPENLEGDPPRGYTDRTLLIVGAPDLALRAAASHLSRYSVLSWDETGEGWDEHLGSGGETPDGAAARVADDAPDAGDGDGSGETDGGDPGGERPAAGTLSWPGLDRAEAAGRPIVITHLQIDLDAEGDAVRRQTYRLRRLTRLARDDRRPALVVLTDVEPQQVLGTAEADDDERMSARAVLRRQWCSLLGMFTFRFATDRGDRERFEDQVAAWRLDRVRRLRLQLTHLPERAKVLEAKNRLEALEKLQAQEAGTDAGAAEDGTPATLPADRDAELAEAKKDLESCRDGLKAALERINLDERLRTLHETFDLVEQECASTGQLQRIGYQAVRDMSPLDAEAFTREKLIAKIALLARGYYRAVWNATSEPEKVVLSHLAHRGLVSPPNRDRLLNLMYRGLVVRDPALRLMNESFALFVRQTVDRNQLLEWETGEGTSVWTILRWLLPVPLLLLGGFVMITQRDAVSSAVGFLIAATSLAPTLRNLFGYFEQRFAHRLSERANDGGSKSGATA